MKGWKPCEACMNERGVSTGWSIESRSGYRNGRFCGTCRGRKEVPVTRAERLRWARIIRSEELTSTKQGIAEIRRQDAAEFGVAS